jgi:hypothetical protein
VTEEKKSEIAWKMVGHLSDPLRKVSINKRFDVCADLSSNGKKYTTQIGVRLQSFSFRLWTRAKQTETVYK